MTVSVCTSNKVIPFVTLYDTKGTKLAIVVEPTYKLKNLAGGSYYLDVAANPGCSWQDPGSARADRQIGGAVARWPDGQPDDRFLLDVRDDVRDHGAATSSLAKWQATVWSGSRRDRGERRILGRAELGVAETFAQPAAGVESAARTADRPGSGCRP